mgnify:CR=1 FL=1
MAAKTSASIKHTLLNSYVLIIFVTLVPILYSHIVARLHSTWYNKILSNVSEATELGQIAKQKLNDEIWDIIAGQKRFYEGDQYILLRRIRIGINTMLEASSEENIKLLEVATRTEITLRYYVDKLGAQLEANATVAENEVIMEEIRSVTSLLYDILQEFIVSEIETASAANDGIQRSFFFLTCIQMSICALIFGIAIYTSYMVSKRIASAMQDMSALSTRIARGELSARAQPPRVEELAPLAANLNTMAVRLQALIDENIREQQNLQKAEMKTLQAQITPHFLYNTFDTIIWLAEAEDIDAVIAVTKAFSQFFRISLSKGHEWITVAQELDHVKSYLTIQKIRYANILDYRIEADESASELPVLKLLLQPLVENAIYHGIKNKRGRGAIRVRVARVAAFGAADGGIAFTVEDNGIGFTAARLAEVREELASCRDLEALKAAYGLYNVNKRLQLYYNGAVSLHIESTHGEGTRVSFTVPAAVTPQGEADV